MFPTHKQNIAIPSDVDHDFAFVSANVIQLPVNWIRPLSIA